MILFRKLEETKLEHIKEMEIEEEAVKFFPIEVIEKNNNFVFRMDAPGLEKKNIDINIKNNIIYVSGEKVKTISEEKEDTFFTERFFGAFKRCISLPQNINTDNITATYINGVLEITIQKIKEKNSKY